MLDAVQSCSIVVVVVIVIGVAAFRHHDAAAERATKTQGQQHQCDCSFHTIPRLSVLNELYRLRVLTVVFVCIQTCLLIQVGCVSLTLSI